MTNREQWLDWFNNLPTCRLVRMICSCTDCGDCAVFGKPNCRMELFKWLECECEERQIVEDTKMTNREWLASMSNKELADFLEDVETSVGITAWECWLEAEREGREKEHEDVEASKKITD